MPQANCVGWMFTYFGTVDKPLQDKDRPLDDYMKPETEYRYMVYQLERCPESRRLHVQGYIEFHRNVRMAHCRKVLPGAHWEPRRGEREDAREYCRKDASRVRGPWESGDWAAGGQGARTDFQMAVDICKEDPHRGPKRIAQELPGVYARFGRGLKELCEELKEPERMEVPTWRLWQKDLLSLIEDEDLKLLPADSRKIYWVCDSVGNRGKSFMCRYLICNHGALMASGKLDDMKFAYNNHPIVCFDVPRTMVDHMEHLYSFAESLKNGIIFSGKYASVQKVFKPPHVVFFANFHPSDGMWSADRVKLFDLDAVYR